MKKRWFVGLFVFGVFCLWGQAAFASVEVYGRASMSTYWDHKNSDWYSSGSSDKDDLRWYMDSSATRFGMNFKSGDITGRFEIDAASDTDMDGNYTGSGGSQRGGLRLRHAYGEWNFGAGKLLIGQTEPLSDFTVTNVMFTGSNMKAWGEMGSSVSRVSQIRLTFGNFKMAALTPNTDRRMAGFGSSTNGVETTIPKLEVRYDAKWQNFSVAGIGGLQVYEEQDAARINGETVTAYMLGVGAKFNKGSFYANGSVNWRQNGRNYGMRTDVNEQAYFANGEVRNTQAWAFAGAIGYKFHKRFTGEIGYTKLMSSGGGQDKTEDQAQGYYFSGTWEIAKGFKIFPEIIVFDRQNRWVNGTETEQGSRVVGGLFWQMDFKQPKRLFGEH